MWLLVTLMSLASCSSAPSWLQGDWYFDNDHTQQAMKVSSANSGAGDMVAGVAAMVNSQIVAQLAGMELMITPRERITTIKGQGHADPYKIVESSADKCSLRMKDGTVETYYRDGDKIYIYSTGTAPFKVYLQRQP